MKYPLLQEQRRCFARRFFTAALWTAFWYAVGVGAIEFFYGPGSAFADAHPFFMGGLVCLLMMAVFIATGYFLVRLVALLRFPARLKKSALRYLPDQTEDSIPLLEEDIRRQWYDSVMSLWLGEDWLVFPGRAMKRDAIVGIYQEDLSRHSLSKSMRLTVVDQSGEEMTVTGPKGPCDYAYRYLINSHSTISWGDKRELTAFRLREQSQNGDQADHRKLRRPPDNADIGLGVCKWDQSPFLEDNHILSQYEKWLLAAYAPYIAGGTHFDGDFDYAGGYPCTMRQRRLATEILKDPWDVRGSGSLFYTLNHLIVTGKEGRDGWQLGRAMMVLGYSYIAGYLARWELLDYSRRVGQAIQECFSSWKELHDSYMRSFRQMYKKDADVRHVRESAYQRLLKDPDSILNTVPFRLDLDAALDEAIDLIGGRPETYDDEEFEDEEYDEEDEEEEEED